MGRGEETADRVEEVHPRVVQPPQGRPLFAQHVRVVSRLDGQIGQFLEGHGPDALIPSLIAQAEVGVVEDAALEGER